jgi:hypothetical protein
MGNKHRHYDVIVAWAAGEEIEYELYGNWHRYAGENCPPFKTEHKWRIKPKLVKKEADVVVYKTSDGEIKAYVSFLGPILQVYNATLIKVIPLEWAEEENVGSK